MIQENREFAIKMESKIFSLPKDDKRNFYFLAVLDLRCCARAFSSCGEQGLLFIAVHRLLTVVASLVVVVEHGL